MLSGSSCPEKWLPPPFCSEMPETEIAFVQLLQASVTGSLDLHTHTNLRVCRRL